MTWIKVVLNDWMKSSSFLNQLFRDYANPYRNKIHFYLELFEKVASEKFSSFSNHEIWWTKYRSNVRNQTNLFENAYFHSFYHKLTIVTIPRQTRKHQTSVPSYYRYSHSFMLKTWYEYWLYCNSIQ